MCPAPMYDLTKRKNWGPCEVKGCKLVYGPRCNTGFCIECCGNQHCYWLGHTMASGEQNTVTTKAVERVGGPVREVGDPHAYSPLPMAYGGRSNHTTAPAEPPKPKVPEPGKMEEVSEEVTLLPLPDNGYAKGGKSGFPVTYIK